MTASLIYIKAEPPPCGIAILIALAVFHGVWIFTVSTRNFHDLRRAYFYRDRAKDVLTFASGDPATELAKELGAWTKETPAYRREIRLEVMRNTLAWFPLVVTVILVILVIWLPQSGLLKTETTGITSETDQIPQGNATVSTPSAVPVP